MEFPESTYEFKDILGELAAGRDEPAERRVESALAALTSNKLPRHTRDELEAVLLMAQGVVGSRQGDFNTAANLRHASYARKFSNPEIRNLPEGAVDLWGLGLARLASARGLALKVTSIYLPLELLEG